MVWPAGEAAFVTGAASGIGLGIARALVAAGAKVALADVDEERLAEAAKELTAAGGTVVDIKLDVSDAAGWEAAANKAEEALGPISILCNNAGVIGGMGPMEDVPLKVWRWVHQINVDGQFLGISTFLPRFKSRGKRAHIVNTASTAGLFPMVEISAYVSSKFASVGLTMALRAELRDTAVGVSMLIPGTVATNITRTAGKAEAELLGEEVNTALVEANHASSTKGADPDRVGEQVLEAMQQRQFMIVTHSNWGPLIAGVHEEVDRAFTEFDGRYGLDESAELLAAGTNPVAT